jgi:uncharacterized protein involved in high-affinity Fe2+ transport
MKKVYFLLALFAPCFSFAQWATSGTNIYNSNSGYVGINTGSYPPPRSPLEVRVNGDNNNVQQGLILQQTNPGSPNNSAGVSLDFGIGNHGVNNNIEGRITLKETYYSARPKMVFSLWDINNTMQERMVIDHTGSVGIGTSLPRSPLEVRVTGDDNSIQTGLIIQQVNPGGPNNKAGVSLDFGIGNYGVNNNIEGRITLKETYYSARPKMVFSLWDANNAMQDRMAIDTDGNVGIGTTAPDAKLAVKGQIHAQEVKIDLNGAVAPDYVFEPTYDLKPLSEIETYIKANKHLPEVPSAKEMEANGVQLGEMNMLLLKKVEELTLYVI